MQERALLKEVPSGKIELVFNGIFQSLQFNCACVDALPMCKAICCRVRTGYNVILQKDEIGQYKSKEHPRKSGMHILQANSADDSCIYLDKDALCEVHGKKPWACRAWHCSPGGVSEDGKSYPIKDDGWILLPVYGTKQDAEEVRDGS